MSRVSTQVCVLAFVFLVATAGTVLHTGFTERHHFNRSLKAFQKPKFLYPVCVYIYIEGLYVYLYIYIYICIRIYM